MSSKKLIILSILFLLLSFVLHSFLPQQSNRKNFKHSLAALQILPERLRGFIAARLWEKADHLMHKGPVVSGQTFAAGSYAGNTDIIPYLKSVIALCPEETAPYRLLASNYAYHLGMRKVALALLEDALYNCERSEHLHELFASVAFIHLFAQSEVSDNRKADLKQASVYLNKAIEKFTKSGNFPDPVFKLENYYIVKARILWELGEPQQGLEAWQMNGENKLEESSDSLARLLLKYKQIGVFEPIKNDEQTDSVNYSQIQNYSLLAEEKNTELQNHEHHHEHSYNSDHEAVSGHEKSLLQALFWLSLKAGFVLLIVILLYFHGSKSCGTVSCAFRFSAGK